MTRACRGCGCTDDNACQGGCFWVEPDLCSRCADQDLARLVELALDHVHVSRGPARVLEGAIAGRACKINIAPGQGVSVVDHIGATAFLLDQDGPYLAGQYQARELLTLFEART